MKLDIDIEKKFNLAKIKIDLHKELNKAGQIIRQDHFGRLEKGIGVDGTSMEPLSPITILRKGSTKILVDTGKMRNLVMQKATRQNQVVIIEPGKTQKYKKSNVTPKDVGRIHQLGLGQKKREWFGISKNAEERALRVVEKRINEELKSA